MNGHELHPLVKQLLDGDITLADLPAELRAEGEAAVRDRKSTRLNSSHGYISYAVFCLKKKKRTYKEYESPSPHPPRQLFTESIFSGAGTTSNSLTSWARICRSLSLSDSSPIGLKPYTT